jgi:simple sugar transport system permease protein
VSGRVTGAFLALAFVFVVFIFTTDGRVLQGDNLTTILDASAQLGIIAIGVTFLMIGGEFDLSVGQTFVLCGMVFGLLLPHTGEVPALAIALLAGLAVGFVNGVATVYVGLPSFIATLGSFYILSGVILLLTQGTPVTPTSSPHAFSILDGAIGSTGIKLEVLWWLGLAVLAGVLLVRTGFGNHVFATGGDRSAARRNGVATNRVRLALFMQCSLLAGLAGIVGLADIGTMAADAGDGLQLDAIAAAVIGGVSLFGGIGGIVDSVIGALFLGLVSTALVLSGASALYYELFVGIVLIVTVALHLRASHLWAALSGALTLRNGADPVAAESAVSEEGR